MARWNKLSRTDRKLGRTVFPMGPIVTWLETAKNAKIINENQTSTTYYSTQKLNKVFNLFIYSVIFYWTFDYKFFGNSDYWLAENWETRLHAVSEENVASYSIYFFSILTRSLWVHVSFGRKWKLQSSYGHYYLQKKNDRKCKMVPNCLIGIGLLDVIRTTIFFQSCRLWFYKYFFLPFFVFNNLKSFSIVHVLTDSSSSSVSLPVSHSVCSSDATSVNSRSQSQRLSSCKKERWKNTSVRQNGFVLERFESNMRSYVALSLLCTSLATG